MMTVIFVPEAWLWNRRALEKAMASSSASSPASGRVRKLLDSNHMEYPHAGRRLHFDRGYAGFGRDRPPCFRAAGIPLDVRKTEPYSSYEKFDFHGSDAPETMCMREPLRLEEMRQSARIIVQAMEGCQEGPFQADAPHVVLPDREKMKTQMEALTITSRS